MALATNVITVAFPAPNQVVSMGRPVSMSGTAGPTAVRIELFADKFHLETVIPNNGQWSFIQPQFSQGGLRTIHAVAFDAAGVNIGKVDVDIIVAVSREMGTDVSDFNPSVNWNEVRKGGFTFAFAKASEGKSFKATTFSSHWKGMHDAGLVRGAYHFFLPLTDAAAQADHYLSVLADNGGLLETDLPPVLDLEHFPKRVENEWRAVSPSERVKVVRTWVRRVEAKLKRKVMFYTSLGFWGSFMSGVDDFVDQPLWVANFTNRSEPFIPDEWERAGKKWTFWQFTESGSVPGVNSQFEDVDRFNGGLDKMLTFIDSTVL